MKHSVAVKTVARQVKLPALFVSHIVASFFAWAAKELKKDKQVDVGGFFILHSKIKPAAPARPGINSSTKEQCIFKARPAKRHVYFKPCKKLLEKLVDLVEESVEEDSWDAPMGASTTESDTNN